MSPIMTTDHVVPSVPPRRRRRRAGVMRDDDHEIRAYRISSPTVRQPRMCSRGARDARAWTTGDVVVVVGVAHDAAFPRTARGTWRHTAHRTE